MVTVGVVLLIIGFGMMTYSLGIYPWRARKITKGKNIGWLGYTLVVLAIIYMMFISASRSKQNQSVSVQVVPAYEQAREYVRVWQATLSESGEIKINFYIPEGNIKPKTLVVTFVNRHSQPLTKKKYTLTEVK